jgi:hypothetical protein
MVINAVDLSARVNFRILYGSFNWLGCFKQD